MVSRSSPSLRPRTISILAVAILPLTVSASVSVIPRALPKLPSGTNVIPGNALDAATYQDAVQRGSIFIHLVGVSHPSPAKKEQFQQVDAVSVREAVKAAQYSSCSHFIYMSVAMFPTRIMRDYQEVRARGEELLLKQAFPSSFIRPWYVLGPGHWWPMLFKPLYFILKRIPATRQQAISLDTVWINQVLKTLFFALKNRPEKNAVYEVKTIQSF